MNRFPPPGPPRSTSGWDDSRRTSTSAQPPASTGGGGYRQDDDQSNNGWGAAQPLASQETNQPGESKKDDGWGAPPSAPMVRNEPEAPRPSGQTTDASGWGGATTAAPQSTATDEPVIETRPVENQPDVWGGDTSGW